MVYQQEGRPTLIYIDLHLVHEVTSPQAFENLRLTRRCVRRPERTVATPDHNVPTSDRSLPIADETSRRQVDALRENCREAGIRIYDLDDPQQGIVHIIGPELGLTQPGMTIVCGDSHTSTHGAFGALAFGIGTSEVEHVLATQTLRQFKPKTCELRVEGTLVPGVTAKDLVLFLIGQLTASGGTGYAFEFTGSAIRSLSMEQRMTVCNMAIEAGAKVGLVAVDSTTLDYVKTHSNLSDSMFDEACQYWKTLNSDRDANFDKIINIDVSEIKPQVTWGTSPEMTIDFDAKVPSQEDIDEVNLENLLLAKAYMGLEESQTLHCLLYTSPSPRD